MPPPHAQDTGEQHGQVGQDRAGGAEYSHAVARLLRLPIEVTLRGKGYVRIDQRVWC